MNHKKICQQLIAYALAAGGPGTKAEAALSASTNRSFRLMDGEPQSFTDATSQKLRLSILIGQQTASASVEDISDASLRQLADQVAAMTKVTPPNRDAMLATPAQFLHDADKHLAALDLVDTLTPPLDAAQLRQLAEKAEQAALAVPGVTRGGGASASYISYSGTQVSSEGFAETYERTTFSVSVSAIAGTGGTQTTGSDWSAVIHFADLKDPAELGRKAGEDAVAMQGAGPIPSAPMTVVFDRDVAGELLDMFSKAIGGMSVAQGNSFLKDALGTQVFAAGINIVDDPSRKRGLGSAVCDGDGVASPKLTLISGGVLQHWLLSLASAKRLGLTSNGRSNGPTNLYMEPGTTSRDDLIKGVTKGLLVTGMIGHANTLTTGDLSRGAEGFLIENGKITRPVSEVTIGGNLKDMFLNMTPADDLVFDSSVCAPTLKVEGMTVAGR